MLILHNLQLVALKISQSSFLKVGPFRSIATYVHGILVRFFHIFVYDIVNIRH